MSIAATDLSNMTAVDFVRVLENACDEQDVSVTDFQQALIVHNAASMGNISDPTSTVDDFQLIQDYFNLNVTSFMVLNSVFLKMFSKENILQKIVVNITSICALQPFNCWALYCSGN